MKKKLTKGQRKIQTSFIQLLSDIGFDKINVRLICQTAKVNRTTFYRHYLDKWDLLDKLIDQHILALEAILTQGQHVLMIDDGNKDIVLNENILNLWLAYFQNQHDFFKVLIANQLDNRFFQQNKQRFIRLIQQSLNENIDHKTLHESYHYELLLGGVTALVRHWLVNDCKASKKHIQSLIYELYHFSLTLENW